MKVLFIASELTPLAKVGGLGDVIGALPKALKNLGIDVRVVIPKYSVIDESKYSMKKVAENIEVEIGLSRETINIWQTILPGSDVLVYLIENQKYLGENGIYFEKTAFCGSLEEIKRFLFFSKAALELFQVIGWQPEIIHCHDWHSAIIPLLLKLKIKNQRPKTILTIHNLANQGKGNAQEILNFLGLDLDYKNQEFNLFEQGLLNTDLLTTVSPTYAKEILTKKFGEGLEGVLEKRKNNLFGILNGLDIEVFNPEIDKNIFKNYSRKNLDLKLENKLNLQRYLNLEVDIKKPLFALISRLTEQKGIDLVIKNVDQIIELGGQLVILGCGQEQYEKFFQDAAQKYPRLVSANLRFDPVLAQKIYAGADLFLMPSRFEPCGLCQLIAMVYGTIPIVRKTGGLADTVKSIRYFWVWQTGTGFVFKKYDSKALLEAIKKAVKLFKNQKKWRKIQIRAMSQDFSWRKSAKKYLEIYQKLL